MGFGELFLWKGKRTQEVCQLHIGLANVIHEPLGNIGQHVFIPLVELNFFTQKDQSIQKFVMHGAVLPLSWVSAGLHE